MTTPRETERLNGELEIDYQRNRVKFHPNALCESAFSLPLTPLDLEIVRSLTQISRRLETHSRPYSNMIRSYQRSEYESCQSESTHRTLRTLATRS